MNISDGWESNPDGGGSPFSFIKVIDKYILVHSTLDFIDNYNDLPLEVFLNKQEENICNLNSSNLGSTLTKNKN